MKRVIASGCVWLASLVSVGEEQPLPTPPTREQVLQMPAEEQQAARMAVKKVTLHRILRQKDDAARLTPENAAECRALAETLHAPAEMVQLLEAEARGPLSGRALYDQRQAFNSLVAAFGVDAVQMRLYVESQSYSTAEMRRALEQLPLETLFNLVPQGELTDEAALQQLDTLAVVYQKAAELYSGVSNREQADAAAVALTELLREFDTTSPVRLEIMAYRSSRFMEPYARIVQKHAAQYIEQRIKLLEADFYGSRLLSTIDFMLN